MNDSPPTPLQSPVHDINELIEFDIRHSMFRTATRFVDYEMIHGDIIEFGVYTGRSLALLAHFHECNKRSIHKLDFTRRIVGFDSFDGLPDSDGHPRWKAHMFSVNHSFHPLLGQGEKVTPDVVHALFESFQLPRPMIEAGEFSSVLPQVIGTKYVQAAVVHIDCDIYQSTRTVFEGIHSIMQEGTILLFDDWFHFKGRKDKGEQRAFFEYADSQDQWRFLEYQSYATFGKSFIVTTR